MLHLVRIALTKPYTFVVLAVLILIVGPLAALRTPIDIFPEIRIPVIAVVWSYTGLPPDEMSGRVMLNFQRALTTTVNDIEHIEGTSYTGVGIVKVFFQPGVDISTANAQVTAIAADRAEADAAQHHAAADPELQRLDRADHPARARRQGPVGAGGVRPRHQHRAHAAGHGAGRGDPLSRTAASSARSRSTSIRRRCRRAACRPTTSPTRSPRRTC